MKTTKTKSTTTKATKSTTTKATKATKSATAPSKRKAPMSADERRDRWREWGKAYRARKAAKAGRTLQPKKVRKADIGTQASATALATDSTSIGRLPVGSLAALVHDHSTVVRHLFKVVFANDCRARVQLIGEDRAVVIKGDKRGYSPIFWDISPSTQVFPVLTQEVA